MDSERYVAYVGTYTHGSSAGIHIYDLDVENGTMKERCVVPVNNATCFAKSNDGQFLYSIAGEGVAAMHIRPDGSLEPINQAGIDGIRGCFLSLDRDRNFLFVCGYHDGKITVLRILEDGSLGEVLDGIYHKGLGSVAERNFRPRVTCAEMTPDGKYLCVVDNGIDQIKLYTVRESTGKLKLIDIIHCQLESGPRMIRFSRDGRFAYVSCELTNQILVYSYDGSGNYPVFERIQQVDTRMDKDEISAASGLFIADSGRYLYCTTAGDNTAGIFRIDQDSGLLSKVCILPISGKYPRDVAVFPDERTLVILNYDSNEIRFFRIDYEKGLFIMKGRPIKIEQPGGILISKINQPG